MAIECHKHQVCLDCNKGMDMVVKVAMECQKHQLGLDCKECRDMVVKFVMECLKHQVGLDSNKGCLLYTSPSPRDS